MPQVLATDREAISEFKKLGVKAKRWRDSSDIAPPADVNYRNELRVHTGGRPELIATDLGHRQAILKPTVGTYVGESFLVGMDETAPFVCRLPQPVATVEEAHTVLRPLGVLPHTLRQGEWFFVPDPQCSCDRPLEEHAHGRMRLGGTTHVALTGFAHGGRWFAKGLVHDERKGRHAPVDLGEDWYEVKRNTERDLIKPPARVRSWHFD
jgi:hypothetical protein